MTPYIGVAGASQPDAPLFALAETLGRRLAQAGAIVLCGGGAGVMTAVCRGAQAEGGTTVGLIPGAERSSGNPYLTVALPTGLGEGRNVLLVRASDALVAVGGGFGTLSEIALALRTGIPVVGLATWGLTLASRPVVAFPVVETPEEAARLALEAVKNPPSSGLLRPGDWSALPSPPPAQMLYLRHDRRGPDVHLSRFQQAAPGTAGRRPLRCRRTRRHGATLATGPAATTEFAPAWPACPV